MSKSGYYNYRLTVALRAPFALAAAGRKAFGVDIAQIRNRDGYVIIPDTHIRGVMRHAWEWTDANGHLAPDRLFGQAKGDRRTDRRDQVAYDVASATAGLIWFSDLRSNSCDSLNNVTRVPIDDSTGTASDGHLFSIEQIARMGDEITFTGNCTAFLPGPDDAEKLRALLACALSCISSLGRFKTVGYGRLVNPDVGQPKRVADALGPPKVTNGQRFILRFTPDKPFLVDISRPDPNTLQGAPIIPGGALKGTLARKFELAGYTTDKDPLASVLSRLRIGHAFPTKDGVGTASVNHDAIANTDLPPTRYLDHDVIDFSDERRLPAFRSDWKSEWHNRLQPCIYPAIEARTRVAINRQTNAAEHSQLFTTMTVVPRTEKEGEFEWTSEIFWPGPCSGPDYDLVRQCLGQFEAGLFTLGKTNAGVIGVVSDLASRKPIRAATYFRIELLTPANLLLTQHMADQKNYAEAIDKYWRAITDYKLRLLWLGRDGKLFSDPDLQSAEPAIYLRHSYRNDYHARCHGANDQPFVLTSAGSVFLLKTDDPQPAADRLNKLVDTGLPIPTWQDGEPDVSSPVFYRENPFVPENGYGAISVEALDR